MRIPRSARAIARRRLTAGKFGERGKGQDCVFGCAGGSKQLFAIALDETRVEVTAGERAALHDAAKESDIGRYPDDFELAERRAHARQGDLARVAPDNQLGDHRIVVGADRVALAHPGIDAHRRRARSHFEFDGARRAQVPERARGGQEILRRVFGVDTRFDRMAVDLQLRLRERQRLARRDPQLPFHQIEAGDHLGHRVLDLQPRVHLHEVEAATERSCASVIRVRNELDGAGTHVANGFCRGDGGFAHGLAACLLHAGRGRFFQHFLMAALDRAVALEEVDAVSLGVREHLDLDVPRAREVLFDQHAVVAERGLGFALAGGERVAKSALFSTTRMPLPPPPAEALISTG